MDETISTHKNTQDRLEIVDKEVVDAELQVGALKRRIALLDEETTRSDARLKENLEKLTNIEKVCWTLWCRGHGFEYTPIP